MRPPREVCSERDVFIPEEVQKPFEAARGVKWQTLILLGYFAGARLSDCARMTWENFSATIFFTSDLMLSINDTQRWHFGWRWLNGSNSV